MTYSRNRILLVAFAAAGLLLVVFSESIFSPSANDYLRSSAVAAASDGRLKRGDSSTTNKYSNTSNELLQQRPQQPQVVDNNSLNNNNTSLRTFRAALLPVSNTTKVDDTATSDDNSHQQQAAVTAAATTKTVTSMSSSSSSTWRLPLYIGAGQGTTGTRTLYESMCSLGIPSVHYEQYCIHPKKATRTKTSTRSTSTTTTAGNTLEQGVRNHQKALVSWKLLRSCAQDYRKHGGCSVQALHELAAQLRLYAANVIDSGIGSVHDVPYTHMVPFIVHYNNNNNTNNEVHGDNDSNTTVVGQGNGLGRGSIVLLTERDPDEWVASRNNHHANSADLICHDLLVDAFDLDECLAKYHDDIEHLFLNYQYTHDNLGQKEEEEFVHLSSQAMNRYQTKIKLEYKPAVVVNFWKETYNVSSLAGFVWSTTKPMLLLSSSSTTTTSNRLAVTAMVKDYMTVAANGGLQLQRSPSIDDLIQAAKKNDDEST